LISYESLNALGERLKKALKYTLFERNVVDLGVVTKER
jgi:hypothetical protein